MSASVRICKDGHTIQTVEDWFRYAPPRGGRAHWAEGRSALECARAWCEGPGGPCVPGEILGLLDSHDDIRGFRIECATPEHKVRFDDLPGEPRNADLVAVARNAKGATVAISVEAKADETFGEPVRDLLADVVDRVAHGERSNLVLRIQQLAAALLPPCGRGLPRLGMLRYQLLTAAAGALAHAREVGATSAVLIVHEFITAATDDRLHASNAADLDAFTQRLSNGAERCAPLGRLLGPFRIPGAPLVLNTPVVLYVGKAQRTLRRPGPPPAPTPGRGTRGPRVAPGQGEHTAAATEHANPGEAPVRGAGAGIERPPRPFEPTAVVDNQDLIARLRRAYPDFNRRNDTTGRAIWDFLRERGGRKLEERASRPPKPRTTAQGSAGAPPRSGARFEIPVDIWDDLFDFLDRIGRSGSAPLGTT